MDAPPTILLFDVMGTIVHDPFYVEMPRFFGMELEELLAVKHPTAWVDFELGRIDGKQMLERFFQDGRHHDHDGFERTVRRAFRYLDGMEELLAELAGASHRPRLFSNYPVWYQWIEEELGLSRHADWSFVSCELGARKPDPEAYRIVLERLAVPASQCLIVDDRSINCTAAQAAGMQVHEFQDAPALREDLTTRGVLPAR